MLRWFIYNGVERPGYRCFSIHYKFLFRLALTLAELGDVILNLLLYVPLDRRPSSLFFRLLRHVERKCMDDYKRRQERMNTQ